MGGNPDISSLIREISRLSSTPGDANSKRAVNLSLQLATALDKPEDTAAQLPFMVNNVFNG